MTNKLNCPTCGENLNHTRLDACLFDYQNYLARTAAAIEAENAKLRKALEKICNASTMYTLAIEAKAARALLEDK
jgi:hypothetical protein